MKFKKNKGGVTITVEEWDNKITLTNTKTGEVLGQQTFSDHVIAVMFAKRLLKS